MPRLGRRAAQLRTLQIVGGSTLLLFVLVAVSAGLYYRAQQAPSVDPVTLCPAAGPTGHLVFLVDMTDPLNFTQKQAFTELLHDVIEKRTPEGYLLSVFVLGEDFQETASPIIELCNPGTGEDKSEYTANRRKLRRQYEERFLKPLAKQTESLVSSEAAKLSPIFEMLQLVSINAFRRHDVKGEKTLIVVSDMLHNTSPFSMYRGPVEFQNFAGSNYGRKVALQMPEVRVELNILINSPHLQTRRQAAFWEAYFSAAGARVVAIRPLEG